MIWFIAAGDVDIVLFVLLCSGRRI